MLSCMKLTSKSYCTACWSGHYKIPVDGNQEKTGFERAEVVKE
jgi:hypothetical protein